MKYCQSCEKILNLYFVNEILSILRKEIMSNTESRYMLRGVSSAKEDVHNAIKNIDKGLYPRAFCKIIPDMFTGDPDWCLVMHADGAGRMRWS